MEKHDNRRKSKRHPAKWKVALILDNPGGEPVILHTQTVDLSLGGVAIVSERNERKDTDVTVLLVQPIQKAGDQPKVLKARARVMSSAPFDPGHRLGLKFVDWTDDNLRMFAKLLGAIEAARPREAVAPASAPRSPDAAQITTSSRLSRLRELAQAKIAEQEKLNVREGADERVSEALKCAHNYLKELAEQLGVVKPAFGGYSIFGVPDFSGLVWDSGRADYRRRDITPTKWLYEQVTLGYRLSGNKQIRVSVDGVRSARLKQVLAENKIQFVAREMHNARGSLESVTFEFPCEVAASVLLVGDFNSGRIQMRLSNVGHFGLIEHMLAPGAVTEEALEEFAGFILGESHRFDRLLRAAK